MKKHEQTIAPKHTNINILKDIKISGNLPSFTYKIRESIYATRYLQSQSIENAVQLISNKSAHRHIGRRSGVRVPKLYAGPVAKQALKEPSQLQFVIKPVRGTNSEGVLLLHRSESGYTNNRTGETYRSWNDILNLYDNKSHTLQVEELIESDDYKIYSFYGETPLILQKRTRGTQRRFRWYNADWEPVRTGKYRISPGLKRPSQEGQAALMDAARRVSFAIPLPFVRVDLYLTHNNGVRLGEVTPHPGSYFKFNEQWDEKLGRCYEEAAARLHTDLLKGRGPSSLTERRPIRSIICQFLSR